ncbi:predicted protein [Botrytis cinerea T4]|uniref:Uncharacterized protein n=1 Tax=Botryotinia fuckeliana (strain T4) TaxID=999810 RepID=G2XU30_BOTF4|nr:predicted protein [Botrytis cinerea T4]
MCRIREVFTNKSIGPKAISNPSSPIHWTVRDGKKRNWI